MRDDISFDLALLLNRYSRTKIERISCNHKKLRHFGNLCHQSSHMGSQCALYDERPGHSSLAVATKPIKHRQTT